MQLGGDIGFGNGGSEKKEDLYHKYNLKGVVVHSGQARSGHYYSFIKEKNEVGQWYQFNDR